MPILIDLSHPLSANTPPFPGDPPVEIEVLQATEESGMAPRRAINASRVSMCVHCGTHVDAPYHFFGNGQTIDRTGLEAWIGPATLVKLYSGADEARSKTIHAADLAPYAEAIRRARRVVFQTGWQTRWMQSDYFTSHPVLSREAAALLVKLETLLVGVDFPSVDQRPNEAHLELLGNGVVILENLTNLEALSTNDFELIALPLPLVGRDGSPVRAVARV